MEHKTIVMAGGDGLTTGILNTIEYKVSSESILNVIGDEHPKYKEIAEDEQEFYSVWGFSDGSPILSKRKPQKGDWIFITNKNAAVYFGEVFLCFLSTELDFIWKGNKGWPYKILFKNIYQIFIPDPKNSYGKSFEQLIASNTFAPSIDSIPKIEQLYNNRYGFRDIIEEVDNSGNFQGAMYLDIDNNRLLDNFKAYLVKSHFECLRRIL